MGVATLEFGVCLHSVIIGLTLAVTEDSGFDVLFIVIIFHQVRRAVALRFYGFSRKAVLTSEIDFSRDHNRCLKVSVSVLVSLFASGPPSDQR
jgi:hypothetical protein